MTEPYDFNFPMDELDSEEFWEEQAKIEFTEALVQAMEKEGLTRSDLSEKMGKSRAYISKIINGNANLTIESMASLAHGLGKKVIFHFADPFANINVQETYGPIHSGTDTRVLRFADGDQLQKESSTAIDTSLATGNLEGVIDAYYTLEVSNNG